MENKMNVVFFRLFFSALTLSLSLPALSQTKSNKEKGLLPEIQQTSENVETNDEKSLASEILITKSEEKAIQSLTRILKKNRGKDQEPDLLNRLAELYMRRSKSGRYFDLQRGSDKVQKAMSHLRSAPQSGRGYIQKAIQTYNEIQNRFPQYPLMDEVLFNNAFAHQQTNQDKKSLDLYKSLIQQFPKSRFVAEAHMGRGEILYSMGNFSESLKDLLVLKDYKNSKVYLYGMYKSAWAYYNLKDSENAVEQLLVVLRDESEKYNLRRETMKDLVLFTSDFYKVEQIYPFFKKHAKVDEMDSIILDFAQLYFSHSRYQELNTLMDKYLDDNPLTAIAVRLEIYFADNYESLKKRDKVVEHIAKAQDLCSPGSKWALKMSQEVIEESCNSKLKSFQAELTVKWWEIWEKNKAHSEFNERLISLLKVAVRNENTAEVDKKTRYLLAELLFHNKKYLEASQEYQIVADKSQDKKLRHDSYYSALFAFEKHVEQNPKGMKPMDIQDKVFVLAEQYIKFSPQGEHADDVRLKMATVFVAKKDFKEAEQYLQPLFSSKNKDLQSKAQDIQLEILNIQKDFKRLKEFSAQLAKDSSSSSDRKKNFEKISKEAEYNDIVLGEPKDEKLVQYARENSGTPLGRQALWQVLSNAFAQKRDFDAIKYGEEFVKTYPTDKEMDKVQKELSAIYLDYGFFEKAAKLNHSGKSASLEAQEKQADFFQLENQWKLAHQAYLPLLNEYKPGSRDYLRVFDKIEQLSKRDSSIKTDKIIQQLVNKGIEPFATRSLVQNAERLLREGKLTAAFEAARKINSRDVSSEEKFPSRLVQASVLEKEFFSQSVKASLERLSLVLSIKTEKFDKAFTAFNDALKMTKDPSKQLIAFLGINRSFDHFISTLENLPLPASMPMSEQEALRGELSQLISPLKDRRAENQEKIASLQGKSTNSENIPLALTFLSDARTKANWPLLVSMDPGLENLRPLGAKEKLWEIGKVFDDLNKPELKEWNLYRLAVLSFQDQKYEKAEYLLARMKKGSLAQNFLRGSIYLKQDNPSVAQKEFEKILDIKSNIDEFKILTSFQTFTRKDYLSTIESLESVKKYPLTDLHLLPVYVDSLVGAGQMDKAGKFLKRAADKEINPEVKETLLSRLQFLQANSRSVSSTPNPNADSKPEVK